ncbi:hypothetical protein KY338_01075 [Candidatus Woesearchaeota archaeon]|nr:hypothetical protein [Candidatus Woesearchaeota archaeon]MBW3006190.1 hypothetical protein [Candidatus Woesearchaeota archaeon]
MEEKKKKITIIILVLIAIIIIGGITWAVYSAVTPKYKKYFKDNYEYCIAERSDIYYLLMAERTGDESYCKKLEDPEGCLARLRKDATVCDTADLPEDEKRMCRAFTLKDSALCPQNASFCMAYTTGDPSHCDNMTAPQEGEIEDCKAYATLNAEHFLDPNIEQNCRDEAYFYSVIKAKEKQYCDKIVDIELRDQCRKLAD